MPAAPPPTITTSVSLLATCHSATIWKDKAGRDAERTTIVHLVDGFCGAIPPQSYSGARPPADIGDHPCTERSWPAFYPKTSIVAAIRMRGSARTLRRPTHDLVRRNRRWQHRSRDSRHASIMNRRPARNQVEGSGSEDALAPA
jgi:hypothetical protein